MSSALKISGLKKTYGNTFEALKGIDFGVQPGDFMALLGPNGAGKSTTIGIISSLVNKSGGKVEVFGKDMDTQPYECKLDIGIVPQEFNFNQFEKVGNILKTQAGYFGIKPGLAEERAEKYLKLLGLWEKRDEMSRMLSGGMKRRLMIARALVHEPRLLILDEPTAGVDIELRRSMWDFLREINEQGTTIILTTHYLEEAEQLCRTIAIIDQGEIIENTDMKSLLKQLDKETFVLDVQGDLEKVKSIQGYRINLVDEHCIEVEVSKGQTLNQLFSDLSELNIEIISLRNKANRLEELFVSLVENKGAA
ncbi:MAG: ABC transporter ATP-binding protein [Pseudomonadales bacterium]|nr:ABC transporter ATP-binding protein [Pseudomonadales bacterium]